MGASRCPSDARIRRLSIFGVYSVSRGRLGRPRGLEGRYRQAVLVVRPLTRSFLMVLDRTPRDGADFLADLCGLTYTDAGDGTSTVKPRDVPSCSFSSGDVG